MADAGQVTVSEPPHRFAYEEEWEAVEGEPPGRLASEFMVEARSGGTCVVRLVSTLYADGEGWDDVLDADVQGLGGLPAQPARVPDVLPGAALLDGDGVLGGRRGRRSCASLGLADARVGERVVAPRTGGRRSSTRGERELQLRLDAPEPGLALVYAYDWRDTTKTALRLYLFGSSSAS